MDKKMSSKLISTLIITILFTKDNFICDCKVCEILTKTVGVVSKCPSNKKEMEEVSRRKNCEQYVKKAEVNKCSDYEKIRYHCVINAFGNQTIEICAPEKRINGYCTEFNEEVGQIQANFYLDCTQFLPPCKSHYNSAEAYLYKNCYNYTNIQEVVKSTKGGNIIQIQEKDVTNQLSSPVAYMLSYSKIIEPISMVIIICNVVLLIIIVILYSGILPKFVRYIIGEKEKVQHNDPFQGHPRPIDEEERLNADGL
ncbi:uncharacterized protein LOC134281240 [Saccostrea cucullata]|uniref:uncharacterized protein LOC134281240 n=1 Tax=Saccostrea cuccullata TaxID=36930 RepID=UPI002ED2D63C